MQPKLKTTFSILAIILASTVFSQTAQEILLSSYRYHDPDEGWLKANFTGQILTELSSLMEQQVGQKSLTTEIAINNAAGNFSIETSIKDDNIEISYDESNCEILVNQSDPGAEMIQKQMAMVNLSNCETARPAINYHIYLMGLPMKLILDEAAITELDANKDFFGNDHYAITVDYPENVWSFYFDKTTYALKGCEFKYKSNGFGEKIVFDNETEVDGMKMFGKRMWYALDGETWLATDNIKFD